MMDNIVNVEDSPVYWKLGNSSKHAPIPCPKCKYPAEFGMVTIPQGAMCRACYEEFKGMSRVQANKYRFVRYEYKMYPNSREGIKTPKSQDSWNYYFDMDAKEFSD